MIPKPILIEIALNLTPMEIMWLWSQSKTFKHIFENEYFWKLKMKSDYPQYPLKITRYYFESYKRLYVSKASKFVLLKDDTKNIKLSKDEFEVEGILEDNTLEELSKLVKERFKCVRGDLVLIEELEDLRDDGTLIYDGENLVNMDYDVYPFPPSSFKVINEFPIRYWDVLYKGDMVYFDLDCHVKEEDIKIIKIEDEDRYMYVSKIVNNSTYYILFDPDRFYGKSELECNKIMSNMIKLMNNINIRGYINRANELPLPLTDINTIIIGE